MPPAAPSPGRDRAQGSACPHLGSRAPHPCRSGRGTHTRRRHTPPRPPARQPREGDVFCKLTASTKDYINGARAARGAPALPRLGLDGTGRPGRPPAVPAPPPRGVAPRRAGGCSGEGRDRLRLRSGRPRGRAAWARLGPAGAEPAGGRTPASTCRAGRRGRGGGRAGGLRAGGGGQWPRGPGRGGAYRGGGGGRSEPHLLRPAPPPPPPPPPAAGGRAGGLEAAATAGTRPRRAGPRRLRAAARAGGRARGLGRGGGGGGDGAPQAAAPQPPSSFTRIDPR